MVAANHSIRLGNSMLPMFVGRLTGVSRRMLNTGRRRYGAWHGWDYGGDGGAEVGSGREQGCLRRFDSVRWAGDQIQEDQVEEQKEGLCSVLRKGKVEV